MPARNSHYARGSASTAPQRQFCPEWWGLTTWLDAVLQNAPPSPYLINIGASDKGAKLGAANADAVGLRMDNTSFRGFAADPGHWRIYGEHKNPNVVTARTAVTPSNIVSLLDAARAPADPHLLKVDIDSYDADVVRAVLTTRQPTFIFVELNEKIPPPLSLCFHYRAWPWHFWHRGGHHYGCSLSAYSELLRGLGYSLVSVILNDALYVRTKRAAPAGFHRLRPPATARAGCRLPKSDLQAYQRGYSQLPKRKELFPWNSNVDAWLDESSPLPARHAAVSKFFWLDTLLGFADLEPLSRRASLPRDYVKWLEGK
jgi:hypothetical protein